ncbi:MAG: Cu2+-exporting ATPase [Planctomycetota bacterium]|nr:MAG: Cu2+-exporting ATPase [Planctomycetota bacterium]
MSHTCSYCGLPAGRSWRHEHADDAPLFCCYGCRFAAEVTRERGESGAAVWTLTKLGLAIFFTLNVICFTMALWTDAVYGESSGPMSASYSDLLRYLGLLFSLPVLFLLGGPLLTNAFHDVRRGRLTTDLLLMTGVVAAFGYSAVSVVRGRGDVYFEVGCVILVTVTLGRWLEATSKLKATQALDELERLLPDRVRFISDDGRDHWIPLAELVPPATVRVLAGERFPADGVLQSESVSVDEQVLTGESWSVSKQRGDRILGGTLNLDGDVLLEVTAAPSQTAVARLIAAVREARKTQGPYQRLSDRVSSWFFPMIAAIAFFAFVFHGWQVSFDRGVMTALAVVLIACPCGLGLATPLAVWTAIGAAAKRQVLFRNGEALERLAEIRELCLDKTGTLTTGEACVTRMLLDESTSRNEATAIAKELAMSSTHAFSNAIRSWADGEPHQPEASARAFANVASIAPTPSLTLRVGVKTTFREARVRSGLGIVAESSSCIAALGNVRLMEHCVFDISPKLQRQIDETIAQGEPLTLIGWSGRVRAAFVFAESLRPSTRDLIDWCRHEGLPVSVLTGDHAGRGERLSNELAVPVHAGLLPDQKARFIHDRQQVVRVGMIGDGVNDAAALTAAHIGISLGAGTDVSRDAAAVCLLNNDLSQLAFAIPLARRTVGTIRRNLAWAFGYNTLGVVVAATGWLNPAIAALLMVASSLVVVRSSSRLSESA